MLRQNPCQNDMCGRQQVFQWCALAEGAANDVHVDAAPEALHHRRVDLRHVRELLCLHKPCFNWLARVPRVSSSPFDTYSIQTVPRLCASVRTDELHWHRAVRSTFDSAPRSTLRLKMQRREAADCCVGGSGVDFRMQTDHF